MRSSLVLAAAGTLFGSAPLAAQTSQPDDPYLRRAIKVLRTSPVIDGHNDLPWVIRNNPDAPGDVRAYDLHQHTPGRTDLARLKAGMVGGQFWSVFIPGERDNRAYAPNGEVTSTPGYARVQLEQIDIAKRMIARYPDRLALALTAADIRADFRAGKVASMLGMEGGHAIENSLGALRAYYDLGVRYMTLTHNVTLDWADAALDKPVHGGLTPFGKEVVHEMNRLGMLVDLSHVSPGTMSDALDVTQAPVIFSHSSARALVNHPRNVPDSILARLRSNGGIVMASFVAEFVSEPYRHWQAEQARADADLRQRTGIDRAAFTAGRAAWVAAHPAPVVTVKDVADHIQHIRDVAGVDHVGIGSDFDGTGEETIAGLEDVSKFPVLFAELARRGWSDADLRKLADQNLLRVMETVEQVAARLQKTTAPSTHTIQELDGAGHQ